MISMRKKKSPKSEKSLISSLSSPSTRSTAGTSLSRELKGHHLPSGTLITTLPFGSAAGHQPRHVIHSHSFAPHQVSTFGESFCGVFRICSRFFNFLSFRVYFHSTKVTCTSLPNNALHRKDYSELHRLVDHAPGRSLIGKYFNSPAN